MREHFRFIFLSLSILFLCGSAYYFSTQSIGDTLTVHFVDVGQGDGIFIETPSHHTMIIDGGPSTKMLRTVDGYTSPLSKNIDVLLATHPDADHVTGLIPVLERYDVHTIIVSPAKSSTGVFASLNQAIAKEAAQGAHVHVGNLGDRIAFGDGVTFTEVSPKTSVWHGEDTNDESVVGVLSYGDYTFLLTGDLPSTREGGVVGSKLVPRNITVLKAGHHGSKYSSSDMFLNFLKPTYAIISAGKDNRYGHPNPEALARLQKNSKLIMSTIDSGTISFFTDGKNMRIETEK
jgi:beta-lactamase superfamily II metal-dependent hydrolase